jgi:hypothetical protein
MVDFRTAVALTSQEKLRVNSPFLLQFRYRKFTLQDWIFAEDSEETTCLILWEFFLCGATNGETQ